MYPGLGLPLRHYPQENGRFYPIGAHENCVGSCSRLLPIRELVMMDLMDKFTDKEDWYQKVHDKEIVQKWREEALALPDEVLWDQVVGDTWGGPCPLEGILTTEIIDYCLQELQNKARHFETSGIVPTFDASASIAKSDSLIQPSLHNSIRQAFNTLIADQSGSPDWHPGSNEMVQDLVHPSMYPLVYGESRVLEDELVGVTDAIDKWSGKGEAIGLPDVSNEFDDLSTRSPSDSDYPFVPPYLWSETYQWLPSNVKFQDDGSVAFTSYINNLHPGKYSEIYKTIEMLVEKALPMWDHCLVPGRQSEPGSKRIFSRFSAFHDPDDENTENWKPSSPSEIEIDWDDMKHDYWPFSDEVDSRLCEGLQQDEWKKLRKPIQRQPDPFKDINYSPTKLQRLSEKFRESGLQIIVKMASIELTPSKPVFPAGSWHIEGQMNERICATAFFYADEENIEPSSLSFRMATSSSTGENDEFSVSRDSYRWLEKVYGTCLGMDGECLQNYGSVQTLQGRLLAFPNVFQHCVSSFGIKDPTKPGHRRFIALWLVDPHTRIISTANVPPQQQDWWNECVLSKYPSNLPAEVAQLLNEKGSKPGEEEFSSAPEKLPAELMSIVRSHFEAPVMTVEKAKEHREALMKARTQSHEEAELYSSTYRFCEY